MTNEHDPQTQLEAMLAEYLRLVDRGVDTQDFIRDNAELALLVSGGVLARLQPVELPAPDANRRDRARAAMLKSVESRHRSLLRRILGRRFRFFGISFIVVTAGLSAGVASGAVGGPAPFAGLFGSLPFDALQKQTSQDGPSTDGQTPPRSAPTPAVPARASTNPQQPVPASNADALDDEGSATPIASPPMQIGPVGSDGPSSRILVAADPLVPASAPKQQTDAPAPATTAAAIPAPAPMIESSRPSVQFDLGSGEQDTSVAVPNEPPVQQNADDPGNNANTPPLAGTLPVQNGSSGDRGNAPGQVGSPGNSGNAPGQGASPPGQDGSPGNSGNAPGQGGTPPGQDGSPGNSGNPPGQGGTPPGQDGSPGNSGDAPGQGGTPPGQDGSPGNSGDAPGQGGTPPGQDGTPGNSGDAPGQGGTPPGQDGSPGNSGNAPGQGGGSKP